MVAGEAPDVIEWRVMQLFHHVKSGRFLKLLLECGKWKNSCYLVVHRATSTTSGNQKKQHVQPIGN
jgi:hypothetical protein